MVSLAAQMSENTAVSWSDATFYWYTGLDRTKVQDSAVVSPQDVQASWDASSVATTAQETGGWILSDGLPFDIEMVFRYSGGSATAVQSVRTRFTCGPAIPQGSVSPPTIS